MEGAVLPLRRSSETCDEAAFAEVATRDPRPRHAISHSERCLMADVLILAVNESRVEETGKRIGRPGRPKTGPYVSPRDRDNARAWLRGEPGFSARECCEALGIDYDAMLSALESEWQRRGKGRPQR